MTSSKKQLPENLSIVCPLSFEAADKNSSPENVIPRFSMVAYTGGVMNIAGFPHPVVVDLEGLSIDRQDIPVRLDHNPRQGVGHTTGIVKVDNTILVEGLVSRDTTWARDVARSGVKGFPWQASIGAAVIEADFIPHGSEVVVNNQKFTGPLHVVRRSVLKEVSFVDSGADTNTQAKIAAKAQENKTMVDTNTSTETKVENTEDQTVEKTGESQETPGSEDADNKNSAEKTPDTHTPKTLNASAAGKDPVAEMRRQMADETRRIEAIRKVCGGKFPDIEASAIEEGWDETKTELHVLRASRPKAPAIQTGGNSVETPQVLEAAALMASGLRGKSIEAGYDERTLDAADKLRGLGIQEFCERAVGRQLPRFRRDATGWLQAAFSTASLPGILSNIANKMLLEGYNYVEDAWRQICKIASVNDFKEHTRYRMTSDFQFLPVGPDGELKHGKISEQQFGQKADTHGIMFALTRQMIINDDMGAFTDIPRQIGIGAAESIADAAWTRVLSNPTQSDTKTFFHADHKNYASGTDTVLSVDGLTAAEVLFLSQTKPNGKPLGVAPSILLVPTALKVLAELLMTSLKLNETTTANKPKPQDNPHAGKFKVVSSTYLSNSSFTGYSNKAWYLFADPNRLPAIEVAFLNGVDRPTVEKTDADFSTLGIDFRGFIDFGVREQDHRGAVKMKGEAQSDCGFWIADFGFFKNNFLRST